MLLETITIAPRFCGPPRSGNGGYVCGRIANHIDGAATVRLTAPPPLDTELKLESRSGVFTLLHGTAPVAEGRAAALDLAPPVRPTFAQAVEASRNYAGFKRHSFPGCFVCGTHRAQGDGLRIFAGRLDGAPVVAAPWTVDASIATGTQVPREFVWAALDCPGAFSVLPLGPGKTMLLGEISARIESSVRAGDRCVAIGWAIGSAGRKHVVGSALFAEAGELVGVARATWIEVPESRFPG